MKNSPSAVAGGLFFWCAGGAGRGRVSRLRARVTFVFGDKSNQKRHLKLRFKTSLRGNEQVLHLRAQASGGHISFCEERNVGKKVA